MNNPWVKIDEAVELYESVEAMKKNYRRPGPVDFPPAPTSRYVYVIEFEGSGLVKIGSSANPRARVVDLANKHSVGWPRRVFISRHECMTMLNEKNLHRLFAPRRLVGEFFMVSFDEAVSAAR